MSLKFTEEDWNRVSRDWAAWWEGGIDRPMVVIHGRADGARDEVFSAAPGFVTSLPEDMPSDEVVDRYRAKIEARKFYGDAWPKWWVNFGPGIMAGFVGAKVNHDDRTVWFEPSERIPIRDLRIEYDPGNWWWRRILDLTETAVEKWGGAIQVGHTDLGGNLDILASLVTTEQLLTDLIDSPEEVGRAVREITSLWIRYYNELYEIIGKAGRGTTPWAGILSPRRCYMLQCDFSYMISPAMFQRFVVPDIEACCARLDHGFYHLDGKGQIPHVDLLIRVERLRGIQWIPGSGNPPADKWLPLLKRIRDGGKLCQLSVSPKGALTIVRELGGKGFAFAVEKEMTEREASDFLKLLTSEDRSLGAR